MTEFRPRASYVEDLLGATEAEFRTDDTLLRKTWEPPNHLRNQKTGQRFHCGTLLTPTLTSLREDSLDALNSTSGTLTILRADKHVQELDVGHLQSKLENRNSLFQVASNFNALELMNKFDHRAMQEVSHYIHDRTQGPFASISAAPGLILRHYFAFYNAETTPTHWRQHFDGQQIELLSNTNLDVRNGYVELHRTSFDSPLDAGLIKICVHRDVQVTFGGVRGSEHAVVTDPSQSVDQVFTATADLACTNRQLLGTHAEQMERKIKVLLLAAYEGALRAALSGGRKRVFLTLIGGGVFANPPAWIVDTIEHLCPLIRSSGLDVRINTFRGIVDSEAAERLVGLAQSTGGSLELY